MKQSKTYNYIYSLSSVLILYMVFMHISHNNDVQSVFLKYLSKIFFFFMPWFFYKSGMFFCETSIKNRVKNDFHKLIYPFIIYSIVGTIVYYVYILLRLPNNQYDLMYFLLSPFKQLVLFGATFGNLPLWFLFTLFLVKALYIVFNSTKYINVIVFAFFVIACLGFVFNIKNPFYCFNFSSGIVFYHLGNKMRNLQFHYPYVFVSILFYIIMILFFPANVNMRENTSVDFVHYILWYPLSLAGIITFNNVFKYLFNSQKLLIEIGKYSMSIFVIHWILMYTCKIFFTSYTYIIELISCLIILPIFIILVNRLRKCSLSK